jgi:hypothetical protein
MHQTSGQQFLNVGLFNDIHFTDKPGTSNTAVWHLKD